MTILRWLIVGITLVFVLNAFRNHWQAVIALDLTPSHLIYSAIALLVTFIAHVWSAIVWAGILRFLQQPAPLLWVLPVYLQTNLAKYIPGNIWHFYGRIRAMQQTGTSLEAATFSTLLEPLLMATAAMLIAIAASQQIWLLSQDNQLQTVLSILLASSLLCLIHPRLFNPILQFLSRFKKAPLRIQHYPWFPLIGELGFISLRGSGFILTIAGFTPLSAKELPLLLGAFSMAWFLGLVIPSPGGIGVFETSVITLLNETFPPAIILGSIAVFRLLSLTAEFLAAAFSFSMTGNPFKLKK